MNKKKDFVSKNKLKMQRGYSYISMFGIPFLVARELSEIFISVSWLFLFILAVVGVWTIGHVDFKHGFWSNELEYSFKKVSSCKKFIF